MNGWSVKGWRCKRTSFLHKTPSNLRWTCFKFFFIFYVESILITESVQIFVRISFGMMVMGIVGIALECRIIIEGRLGMGSVVVDGTWCSNCIVWITANEHGNQHKLTKYSNLTSYLNPCDLDRVTRRKFPTIEWMLNPTFCSILTSWDYYSRRISHLSSGSNGNVFVWWMAMIQVVWWWWNSWMIHTRSSCCIRFKHPYRSV